MPVLCSEKRGNGKGVVRDLYSKATTGAQHQRNQSPDSTYTDRTTLVLVNPIIADRAKSYRHPCRFPLRDHHRADM